MTDQNQQYQGPDFQPSPNPQPPVQPWPPRDYVQHLDEQFQQAQQAQQNPIGYAGPHLRFEQPKPQMSSSDKTLRLIALIVNLASILLVTYTALSQTTSEMVALIALAWIIPMTVISGGIYKGTKKNTTAFGVCTLLFVNIISGILLLMSTKDDK